MEAFPAAAQEDNVVRESEDSSKRPREMDEAAQSDAKKPRSDVAAEPSPFHAQAIPTARWKVNKMTEDYVEFASQFMLTPLSQLGNYGYDPSRDQIPLRAISALDYLKSLKRRRMVAETWSPYEVAVFEAAIVQYGKEFSDIQKEIQSKTTKEVIDFYYMWKKTSHYKKWKKSYIPPFAASDDEEEVSEGNDDDDVDDAS